MKTNLFKTLVGAIALSATLTANAQVKALDPFKPLTATNPSNPLEFCADPTAVEHEGRLYVYTTNDQQEYDARNGEAGNSYSLVSSIMIMSTTDMVNWTHHGSVGLHKVCGNFVPMSWAPSIVKRVEDDGLTHFYMYFSIGAGGVGVVTSTSPVGPWTSPLNRPLVDSSTPGATPCSWIFDPGVVIDDNGVGWMAFGGGDPVKGATDTWTKNPRMVRLGKDMISLDSEIVPIKAPYHFEANELNFIGGKYVYTYCSNWASRDDWSTLSLPGNAPSICSMAYMVTDNPLDPDGWTWGGEVLANPGAFGYEWANNHTHMHKYNGKYYMLYHAQSLRKYMGIDKPDYRSLGVNTITVNEETARITPTRMGAAGAAQIAANRPLAYERQQAEMIWNGRGLRPKMEGDAGNTVMLPSAPGCWLGVKSAVFGTTPMKSFTARMKGRGRMEVRIDNANGAAVATVDFCTKEFEDISVPLTKGLTGTHNIFFVFDVTYGAQFDEWQFSADEVEAPEKEEVKNKFEHGVPYPSYAYLDGLRPLKEYIDYDAHPNFHLGAAILAPDYNKGGTAADAINSNFTEVVAGNEMKMQFVVDNSGNMHFSTVKEFVKKITDAGLSVYGHTLAWHSQQNPVWLNGLLKGLTTQEQKHDVLVGAMDKFIGGMMNATEGKVKAWDVVNEPLADGWDGNNDGIYDLKSGDNPNDFYWATHMGDLEYVRQAVRLAREHYAEANGGDDGKLKLFINDYNLESDWDNNKKVKSLIRWIKLWEADGVTKIDGIGTQMHINCYMNSADQNRKKNAIKSSFKLMAATGKLVRISELDMGLIDSNGKHVTYDRITEEQELYMADFYEWIFKTYLEVVPAKQQWGICIWSLGDQGHFSGWRPGAGGGLWACDWYRKHNYGGVARGLGASSDDSSKFERYEGAEVMANGKYYLYNPMSRLWFSTSGGRYGTAGSLSDKPSVVQLIAYNGGYAIKTPEVRDDTYYGWFNNDYYVDQTAKEKFNFVNTGNNIYQIVLDFNKKRHLAYASGDHPLTDNYEKDYDLWQLIPADEATGIDTPAVNEEKSSSVMYNLAGQRVSADYKGIVIMNGKKYIRR